MHAGLLRVESSRILYSGWSHVYVHFVQHIHHVGRALLHGCEAISKYLHARFDMCFGICTVWQNVFKGIDSRQSLFISLAEVWCEATMESTNHSQDHQHGSQVQEH